MGAPRDLRHRHRVFVHLPATEPACRPETRAPLIGKPLGDFPGLWLLGPADGARYRVVQGHPRHACPLVDLPAPNHTGIVV